MILKKIKAMSLHEVGYRIKKTSEMRLLRLSHENKGNPLASECFLPEFVLPTGYDGPYSEAVSRKCWRSAEDYLLEYMKLRVSTEENNKKQPKFFLHRSEKSQLEKIVNQFPKLLADSVQQADELMNHRFRFLGLDTKLKNGIDWFADPGSGRRWPEKYYTELKFYGQGDHLPGDVKYVWELNRHQHLAVLGKAYWLTGDEKYAAEVICQMKTWMQQNVFLRGVNWTSALEIGIRSISWIWAYFFCLKAQNMDSYTNAKILRMIHLHGQYIFKHLSFFTSPYNHLVGEATALFFIGLLFPEFKEAATWQKKGWEILQAEATKQFHYDGMSVEQAMPYHHFTLGLYQQAVMLARLNDIEIPYSMKQVLENALDFSLLTIQPDGCHPVIGDCDDARPFYFGRRHNCDYRDLLALGAIMFRRGDFKAAATDYDESCLWFLGAESYHVFNSLKSETPKSSHHIFHDSGYATFRTGWSANDHYLLFDCGPQSHGLHADEIASTAHGHADFLNIVLSAHGKPVLVDSGIPTYNGDLKWQTHFRSGMAHNTITINKKSACRVVGRLGYSNVPDVEQSLISNHADFSFIEGTYVGFEMDIRHRRGIFYRRGEYWLVLDALYGEGRHVVDRWLHFAPTTELVSRKGHVLTDHKDGKNVMFAEVGPRYAVAKTFHGGDEPERGWISPGYGRKVAAPVVRYRSREILPAHFCTLIYPYEGTPPVLSHECSGQHSTQSPLPFSFRLKTNLWEDLIIFNFTGRTQEIENIRSDARIICIRKELATNISSIAISHGTELNIAGNKIFQAEKAADAKVFMRRGLKL